MRSSVAWTVIAVVLIGIIAAFYFALSDSEAPKKSSAVQLQPVKNEKPRVRPIPRLSTGQSVKEIQAVTPKPIPAKQAPLARGCTSGYDVARILLTDSRFFAQEFGEEDRIFTLKQIDSQPFLSRVAKGSFKEGDGVKYSFAIRRFPSRKRNSDTEVEAAVSEAIAKWDALLPGVTFVRDNDDTLIEIAWVDPSKDAGFITKSDPTIIAYATFPIVRLDDTRRWEAGDSAGEDEAFDIGSVILHEFGHILGIRGDKYELSQQVMNSSLNTETVWNGLSEQDIALLAELYQVSAQVPPQPLKVVTGDVTIYVPFPEANDGWEMVPVYFQASGGSHKQYRWQLLSPGALAGRVMMTEDGYFYYKGNIPPAKYTITVQVSDLPETVASEATVSVLAK